MTGSPVTPAMLVVTLGSPVATAATRAGIDALRSPALALILAERVEQIEKHGHDGNSDDGETSAEIARAALAYLTTYLVDAQTEDPRGAADAGLVEWPWTPESFRPFGEVEMLAKAGALILAELDRLIRAAALLEHVR